MKSILFILFLPLVCLAQHPLITGAGIDWTRSTSSRWYPTNAANPTEFWAEQIPFSGTFDGALSPVGDNHRVVDWTNYARSGSKWHCDQTTFPTNFTSGGGGNATSPRMQFGATAVTPRMVGITFANTTNQATFIFVANCTDTTSTDQGVLNDTGAAATFIRFNAKKIEISQGTTLSSPNTLGTGYYVFTAVFAAGASSHVDTNGTTMVTGTAGTANIFNSNGAYIDQKTSQYSGNICRIWGWDGVLSAGDLSAAVTQCKTDFGIP